VNDIVHEVEKQLEGLKRQAGKARRYRVLRDEMIAVQRVLFGRRFLDLQEQSRALSARLADESGREQAAAIALEAEEAQMEARRGALYDAEGALEQARARLSELTLAVDRHQGRSGYCREQIEETERRRTEEAREAEELHGRVAPLAPTSRCGARTTRGCARGSPRRKTRPAARTRRPRPRRPGSARRKRSRRRRGRARSRSWAGWRLCRTRGLRDGQRGRAAADLVKLAAEIEELDGDRRRIESLRAEARAREEAATTSWPICPNSVGRPHRAARGAAPRRGARAGSRCPAERARRLAGRLASLEDIVATHAAFDEGARALLAAPESIEVLGVVADAVEADSAHERAVEAFLGDRLQAVLVPTPAGPAGASASSKTPARAGERCCCSTRRRPRPRAHACATSPAASPASAVAERALPRDRTPRGGDPQHPSRRAGGRQLRRCAGGRLRPRRRPLRHAVRGDAARRGRRSGAGGKGLLAPRREIREVTSRLGELETLLASARARVAAEATAATAAEAEAAALAERIHAAEKELVAVRHDLAAADEEAARLHRKAAVLDTSAARPSRSAARRRCAWRAGGRARRGGGRARERRRPPHGAGTAVASARTATEAAHAVSSEARSVVAGLRERAAAAETELRRFEDDWRELEGRIAAGKSRAEELARRGDALRSERAESERLLAVALTDRDRVTGKRPAPRRRA